MVDVDQLILEDSLSNFHHYRDAAVSLLTALLLLLIGCGNTRLNETAQFTVNVNIVDHSQKPRSIPDIPPVSLRAYFDFESGGASFTKIATRPLSTGPDAIFRTQFSAKEICHTGPVSACHLLGMRVFIIEANGFDSTTLATGKVSDLTIFPDGSGGKIDVLMEFPF